MNAKQRFGRWAFARRVMRWLPARLKEQFGAEIEEVFAARLDEAAGRGWLALIGVLLRELIHLPPIHAREVWFRRRGLEIVMTENSNPEQNNIRQPLASWKSAALWALPLLLFGLGLTLLEFTPVFMLDVGLPPPFSTGVVALLAAQGLILAVLAFTLNRNVSAGWFINLGLALTCAWYLSGMTSWGKPVGSWMWWGFLIAAAIAVLRARSIRVLWAPFQAAWRDWTHLSFLVYGGLAFLMLTSSLDSVKEAAAIPRLMGGALIFALAAVLALRVVTPLRRVLVLDAAMALMVLVPLFLEVFNRPNIELKAWLGLAILMAIWLGSMFVPGLLGLLRMGLRHRIGA